jgi:MFS transporter, DHA2 family, multidrug resistance protein
MKHHPSPAPTRHTSDRHPEIINTRRFAAFLCMVFGMFMAILDIQIVAASLAQIQAGLAASSDEIPWVQTAYLIAEVVMIPLSGYLSRALGTRTLFTLSAAGFTFMSILCGTAKSIDQMIIYRILQGFIGGGMIPTVFSAAYIVFPKRMQATAGAIVGLVATLAPTIGPTVGGYLTDLWSWQWIFLINVVPGVIVTLAVSILIDFDEADYSLFRRLDYAGLVAMALFLGSAEFVLEEGPRKDWLDDSLVGWGATLAVVAGIVFFWRTLSTSNPIVDLRAFTNKNFAMGSLFSFILGIGLYGMTYLYPLYLARVRGYSAIMIGQTMFVSGASMFVTAPIAGRFSDKCDPRLMLFCGLTVFAAGTFILSDITMEWDFYELIIPQMLRGCGLMLSIVPITVIALGTLSVERVKNASGLFNLMRNLGGAVGLAVINTLLDERRDVHHARLADSITWSRDIVIERVAILAHRFRSVTSDAELSALKQIKALVLREATVMAFADVFLMLTATFVCAATLIFMLRKPASDVCTRE